MPVPARVGEGQIGHRRHSHHHRHLSSAEVGGEQPHREETHGQGHGGHRQEGAVQQPDAHLASHHLPDPRPGRSPVAMERITTARLWMPPFPPRSATTGMSAASTGSAEMIPV